MQSLRVLGLTRKSAERWLAGRWPRGADVRIAAGHWGSDGPRGRGYLSQVPTRLPLPVCSGASGCALALHSFCDSWRESAAASGSEGPSGLCCKGLGRATNPPRRPRDR